MTKSKIKITPKTKKQKLFDEIRDELPSVEDVNDEMSCAECCETLEDLRANMEAAAEAANTLASELRALIEELDNKLNEDENEDE